MKKLSEFIKIISKKDNDKIIEKINEFNKNSYCFIEDLLSITMYYKNNYIFKYLLDTNNINYDNGSGITIMNSIIEKIIWDTINNKINNFDNNLWLLIVYADGDLSIGHKKNFYQLISDFEYQSHNKNEKIILENIKKTIYKYNLEKNNHKLALSQKRLNICKHKNNLDSHIIKDILTISEKMYYKNLTNTKI